MHNALIENAQTETLAQFETLDEQNLSNIYEFAVETAKVGYLVEKYHQSKKSKKSTEYIALKEDLDQRLKILDENVEAMYVVRELEILKIITLNKIPNASIKSLEKLLKEASFEIDVFEKQLGSALCVRDFSRTELTQFLEQPLLIAFFRSQLLEFEIEEKNSNDEPVRERFRIIDPTYFVGINGAIVIPENCKIRIVPNHGHDMWKFQTLVRKNINVKETKVPKNNLVINRMDGTSDVFILEERFLPSKEASYWKLSFYDDAIITSNKLVAPNTYRTYVLASTIRNPIIHDYLWGIDDAQLKSYLASNKNLDIKKLNELIGIYLDGETQYNCNWEVCAGLAKNPKVAIAFPEKFDQLVQYPHIEVKRCSAENPKLTKAQFKYLSTYSNRVHDFGRPIRAALAGKKTSVKNRSSRALGVLIDRVNEETISALVLDNDIEHDIITDYIDRVFPDVGIYSDVYSNPSFDFSALFRNIVKEVTEITGNFRFALKDTLMNVQISDSIIASMLESTDAVIRACAVNAAIDRFPDTLIFTKNLLEIDPRNMSTHISKMHFSNRALMMWLEAVDSHKSVDLVSIVRKVESLEMIANHPNASEETAVRAKEKYAFWKKKDNEWRMRLKEM